jgi:hypothetical protein
MTFILQFLLILQALLAMPKVPVSSLASASSMLKLGVTKAVSAANPNRKRCSDPKS